MIILTKIMIVEDDEAIRVGLKYYLEQETFEVIDFGVGLKALDEVNRADLVLLDLNLPDINGFDLFKKIRAIKNVPIIFLTANDLEVSVVMGLDMGADDYITKPFKAKELTSRIKNVLRRTSPNASSLVNIKNIIIDTAKARVTKDNHEVFLTALEYKILLIFALNPGIVFSREKILANIWDVNEEYVNDNTLTVYIKRIREKIEDDMTNPKIIETVRGLGYKLGD